MIILAITQYFPYYNYFGDFFLDTRQDKKLTFIKKNYGKASGAIDVGSISKRFLLDISVFTRGGNPFHSLSS